MHDIFISYATEDRERAKELAQALEREGWSVWWDRMIPFGRPFDEVIEENLNAAKCVIVMWSAHSVTSKWVRSEATEADERNALIPVLLESDVDIPIAFKLLQAAKLADWDGDAAHAEFSKLVSNIRSLISATPAPAGAASVTSTLAPPVRSKPVRTRSQRARVILGLLVLPSVIAAGAAAALMLWRVPTKIEAELQLHRVAFTLAGAEPVPLFERAVGFRGITVERFSSLRFTAQELRLPVAGTDSTWREVALARPAALSLSARAGERASLTLEAADPGAEVAGRLEAISAQPGAEIVVEMQRNSAPALTLQIEGEALAPSLLPVGEFELNATGAAVESAQPDLSAEHALRLRARLAEAEPFMQLQSGSQGLVITLTPKKNAPLTLLPSAGAAIRAIEFIQQNSSGGMETALAAAGTLKYPDFPAKAPVKVEAHQFLGLKELSDATITQLQFDAGKPGLQLRVQALAGSMQTKAGATLTDHRLTRFDQLWHGSRAAILFSIAVWVFSVSLGGYKLYTELSK